MALPEWHTESWLLTVNHQGYFSIFQDNLPIWLCAPHFLTPYVLLWSSFCDWSSSTGVLYALMKVAERHQRECITQLPPGKGSFCFKWRERASSEVWVRTTAQFMLLQSSHYSESLSGGPHLFPLTGATTVLTWAVEPVRCKGSLPSQKPLLTGYSQCHSGTTGQHKGPQ